MKPFVPNIQYYEPEPEPAVNTFFTENYQNTQGSAPDITPTPDGFGGSEELLTDANDFFSRGARPNPGSEDYTGEDFGESFQDFMQSEEYLNTVNILKEPRNYTSDMYTSELLGGATFGSSGIGRAYETAYQSYQNRINNTGQESMEENTYTFDPTQYSFGTGGVSGFYETLATDHMKNDVGLGAGYIPGFEENISGSVTLLKLASGTTTFEELTPQQQQSVLASAEGYQSRTSSEDAGAYESSSGQVVAGDPEYGQVNIVDYTGLQAGDPTLPEGSQLSGNTTDIEVQDNELLALKEQYKLATGNDYVPLPGTTVVDTVTSPDKIDAITGEISTVTGPDDIDLVKTSATTATDKLVDTEAVTGEVSDDALVDAAYMDPLSTEVGSLSAAQIAEATQVKAPASRTLQSGELVQAAADALKASAFVEQITAAQADPTARATVQGQLDDLMKDFDGGSTPPWAAGALRAATAAMAARGLGSSSLAGQAIVQAAMESALPIAQADASTFAQFESQNLSNRQARAMLAAQQRATFIGQEFDQQFQSRVTNAAKISDIANINFNATQQIALENARLTQTVNLANLGNRQALVMAEAAQIANLESANLNNRQQAAVQNAQSFLQMDLANLSNEQQAVIFDAGARVQTLLSDQAAENTARNLNMTEENRLNQFFAELDQNAKIVNATELNSMTQFNATAKNQMSQFFAELGLEADMFNSEEINDMSRFDSEQLSIANQFNAEMDNLREQYNIDNQLEIDASNVGWRRDVNTINTATDNAATQFDATNLLDVRQSALNNIWQHYDTVLNFAFTAEENAIARAHALILTSLQAELQSKISEDSDMMTLLGVGVEGLVRLGTSKGEFGDLADFFRT